MEKSNESKLPQWYERWSLFEEPKAEAEQQEHPLFIFVFSFIFMVGCSIVSVWVVWTSVIDWPTTLKVYKSDDPRPQPGYTCACNLPGDLSGPAALVANDPKILHRCYEREKLETVTVLQYDPSINLLGTGMQHISMNDKSRVLRNFTGGYEVEVDSRVAEVTLRKGDSKGYFDSLHPYKGIESNTIDIPFDDILRPLGVLNIPNYYVRWGFEFDCMDCSTCSPSHLNKKIPNFSSNGDVQWASCFAYGQSPKKMCFQDNSYHGKCTLHPTSLVPPLFALKEFLHNFKSFQSVINIRGLRSGKLTPNALTLESSFMYLVESDVKEISSIDWGFLEVNEQHPWWLVLHGLYPNISQECGKMSRVKLCHLPKLCSAALMRLDQDDISHLHTRCIQLAQDTSLCQEMVSSTHMEIENLFNDNEIKENQTTRICPNISTCKQVRPNYVTYKPPMNSRVIGIDSKNYIRGWCTKIYNDVLRSASKLLLVNKGELVFEPQEVHCMANARYNGSKLLSTHCINGLCRLTGRYNEIDDVDGDVHTLSHQEYNLRSGEQSFLCYKVVGNSKMRWTIDTFGVLFGWIGTLQLAFVLILSLIFDFMKRVEEDEEASLD